MRQEGLCRPTSVESTPALFWLEVVFYKDTMFSSDFEPVFRSIPLNVQHRVVSRMQREIFETGKCRQKNR